MSIRSLEAPNIKFVSWAPQNDVLGHPSVKAFISHGGSNSMYEAAFHGVPLVCIPFMGDQPDNAAKVRIVNQGMMRQCTVVATTSVSLQLILISLPLHYMHHKQVHMPLIGFRCTMHSRDCLWCVLGLDKALGDTSVRHRLQPKCPVPSCKELS